MIRRFACALSLALWTCQWATHAETISPAKPLTEHINVIKPKAQKAKEDLAAAIKANQDLNKAIAAYNRTIDGLRSGFLEVRTKEYEAVREKQQQPQLAAEKDHVTPGQPRRSDNKYATYDAPEGMVLDSFDWREVSSYGDTHKEHASQENGTRLWIHLNARSRYRPSGRSRIEVEPLVMWKFEDPDAMAVHDWDEIHKILNQ